MHQVDTNVSRDPATQQSADEMYALCMYSVQLPPGPTECSFLASAPERQKQRFQVQITLFYPLIRMGSSKEKKVHKRPLWISWFTPTGTWKHKSK